MLNRVHKFKVFTVKDIAELAAMCREGDYGFVIYKNVVVFWDEDYDSRIFDFVDSLSPSHRNRLSAACESEACLMLVWDGNVPDDRLKINTYEGYFLDGWDMFSIENIVRPIGLN